MLILALPLGLGAVLLHFVFESPKFLLNAGKEGQALEILRKIYKRNGDLEEYPVRVYYKLSSKSLKCYSKQYWGP